MNKNMLTNLIALFLVGLSFALPQSIKPYVLSVGLFALSGALTNSIAIYMLFERVPFLYGSGVITLKFESFKASIAELIMREFFTIEHLDRFTQEQKIDIDLDPVIDKVDLSPAFEGLVEMIMNSSFGGMLGMFGGEKVLRNFEAPFDEKMRSAIKHIAKSENFKSLVQEQLLAKGASSHAMIEKIEEIVLARLDELTPEMVKDMIKKIIHEHLGWLVVWGGVFGGLIGLISAFIL